jgi:hypothetical protein
MLSKDFFSNRTAVITTKSLTIERRITKGFLPQGPAEGLISGTYYITQY